MDKFLNESMIYFTDLLNFCSEGTPLKNWLCISISKKLENIRSHSRCERTASSLINGWWQKIKDLLAPTESARNPAFMPASCRNRSHLWKHLLNKRDLCNPSLNRNSSQNGLEFASKRHLKRCFSSSPNCGLFCLFEGFSRETQRTP